MNMFRRGVCTLLLSVVFAVAGLNVGIAQEDEPVSIIFMHHSTGENLIVQGDVREAFTDLGYAFWDHGYNGDGLVDPEGNWLGVNWDVPGDNTDPDGWYDIFNQPVTDPPENTLSHMLQHDVIAFKSCFPASDIQSEAQFRDYQRYYLSIRDAIDQHPDRLFVPFTTPPLVPNATTPEAAARARRWAEYLTSDEYLEGHPNIAVFDIFDLLADEDGYLREDYRPDEWDSHPNERANQTVGPLFVAFVDEAIREFIPGEVEPEPEVETPVLEVAGVIDDFESGDLDARWWAWVDAGGALTCAAGEAGYESDAALQLELDTGPEVYGGCGREVNAEGWGEAAGLSFVWRADTPGLGLSVVLMVEGAPFVAALETTDAEWTSVTLPWDAFAKPDWAADEGPDALDPARVTEIGFDIGHWEAPQQGVIWIDALALTASVDG
ncbi:MAG: hypothetical protein Kow00120_26330 [Anaerolineae bacterium]